MARKAVYIEYDSDKPENILMASEVEAKIAVYKKLHRKKTNLEALAEMLSNLSLTPQIQEKG
jgi:hypothetical protein